jgi:hypothetical protein
VGDHLSVPVIQSAQESGRAASQVGGVAITAEAQRRVRRIGQQTRQLLDIPGVLEQRGGRIDAFAQGVEVRRCEGLGPRRLGDLALVTGRPRPVERLVRERVCRLAPPGVDLRIDPLLERLGEDHGIAKLSSRGLQFRHDRGALGSPPHLPTGTSLGAQHPHAAAAIFVGAGQVSKAWSIQATASAQRWRITQ